MRRGRARAFLPPTREFSRIISIVCARACRMTYSRRRSRTLLSNLLGIISACTHNTIHYVHGTGGGGGRVAAPKRDVRCFLCAISIPLTFFPPPFSGRERRPLPRSVLVVSSEFLSPLSTPLPLSFPPRIASPTAHAPPAPAAPPARRGKSRTIPFRTGVSGAIVARISVQQYTRTHNERGKYGGGKKTIINSTISIRISGRDAPLRSSRYLSLHHHPSS